MEEWRSIIGFEGAYEVSDEGRIKSCARTVVTHTGKFHTVNERILKHDVDKHGYHHVGLYRDGKEYTYAVHRLVAAAFIPNPENKPTVNHIDGDKSKNCASNLEWATTQENIQHAIATGLTTRTQLLNSLQKATAKNNRKVICIETQQVYASRADAAEAIGLPRNSTMIYDSIKYGWKVRGKYTFKEYKEDECYE